MLNQFSFVDKCAEGATNSIFATFVKWLKKILLIYVCNDKDVWMEFGEWPKDKIMQLYIK